MDAHLNRKSAHSMYTSPRSNANAAGRMTDYEFKRRKEGVMEKIKLPSHRLLASTQSKEPRTAMTKPSSDSAIPAHSLD